MSEYLCENCKEPCGPRINPDPEVLEVVSDCLRPCRGGWPLLHLDGTPLDDAELEAIVAEADAYDKECRALAGWDGER